MNSTIGQLMTHPPSDTPPHEGVENPNPWVVFYLGRPVRFFTNIQKRWLPCHIDEATTFETHDDALVKLVDWQLHGNSKFTVRRKHLKHER